MAQIVKELEKSVKEVKKSRKSLQKEQIGKGLIFHLIDFGIGTSSTVGQRTTL